MIHDNLADTRKILNRLVYEKGGWTLHMLRGLGTETFWAGIRDYYRRHRDGNVSTDDFRRVMEEASGQDLAWFFHQWLKRPGSPEVKGTWHFAADRKEIAIELSQVQPGEPYRLPLELGINLNGRQPRNEKLELTGRDGSFKFKIDQDPQTVTLDPNRWVLMKQTFTVSGSAVSARPGPTWSLVLQRS